MSPSASRGDAGTSRAEPSAPANAHTDGAESESWQALCARTKDADFPTRDQPNAREGAQLKPGDSVRYYYGVGTDVDYVRARHAAFVERAEQNGAFTAATVLMMLYANGFGVERNLDLAIHINCTIGEGESEIKPRTLHLNSMRTMQKRPVFDFCDDVSGGLMEGHCADLDEKRKAGTRDAELARMTSSWSVEQKTALDKLRAALDKFISARASHERDLSAADRSSVMTEEEANQRQRFFESLRAFEKGELPSYDAERLRAADAALNGTYQAALKKERVDTTVTAAGIKATEKAWIAYREAWVQFGLVRYPAVSAAAWKTWLTLQRTDELEHL